MNSVFFNFYGEKVCVISDWEEQLFLLKKDFSIFESHQKPEEKQLTITLTRGIPSEIPTPVMVSRMQTLNSITYQQGSIRYNDYYGKLLSIFDYDLEKAELISEDADKMHEVAYLLILSRIGKKLDLRGVHKLHAFAISYNGIAFVCMMPMKGGKSTLLLELLKYEKVKMISDDIPLIDKSGNVLPFPIKIGIEEGAKHSLVIKNPEENIYQIKREQYGIKTFICLNGIMDKVELPENVFTKIVIAEGFRFNSNSSEVLKSSWLTTFKGLFKHGIIGVGLPMMVEYFWEFGLVDFVVKTKIFFFRFYGFLVFSLKSNRVKIKLGKRSDLAAAEIIKYLDSEFNV